jgi:hypothetical protein
MTWHTTTTEKPANSVDVLGWTGERFIVGRYYCDDGGMPARWIAGDKYRPDDYITHWMPLPTAPAPDDDVEISGNCEWEWLLALGFKGKLGNTCGWSLKLDTPSGLVVVWWNDHSFICRPMIEWPVPIKKLPKTRGEFRAALATL